MARAALVACTLAAAASLPLPAALAAPTAGSTFVVRGVVVQYIPPSGSVVGSLSIRVVKTDARGRALLGELVTVAVEQGDAPKTGQPLRKSLLTLTLEAPSPASILEGGASVRSIAPSPQAPQAPVTTPPAANPPATPGKGDSDGGSSQSGERGQSGDHGSGQASDPGSAAQGRSGGGGSNGHK
jgi:uncharacterized membrane protein YgcG